MGKKSNALERRKSSANSINGISINMNEYLTAILISDKFLQASNSRPKGSIKFMKVLTEISESPIHCYQKLIWLFQAELCKYDQHDANSQS